MLHWLEKFILGWIVDAPHVAGDAQEMHREKRPVEKNVSQNEMNHAQGNIHHAAKHFREPVINRCEQSEHDTRYDVVEMRNDKIGVVNENVDRCRSHKDTTEAADQKIRDKTQSKQHRHGQANRAAPERTKPVEYFDRRR